LGGMPGLVKPRLEPCVITLVLHEGDHAPPNARH
jgi:hypothetical protein